MNNFNLLRYVALLMLCVALGACSEKEPKDLVEFVSSAYKDKKPDIQPLPTSRPYKPFAYSAGENTDPFSVANIITERPKIITDEASPDDTRVREKLEEYPLDALTLVGTLTQKSEPWVIVQTADGLALRAAVGNYMGQNEGKIIEIHTAEAKVVLAELVQDPVGRWVTRELELTIDE